MQITVRADKERLKKLCPLDDIIGFESMDWKAMKNILARFLVDPKTDDFYPVEIVETEDDFEFKVDPRALALLGKLPVNRILDLGIEFRRQIGETAAPPTNAGTSTTTT